MDRLVFDPTTGWNDQTIFKEDPDAADVRPLLQRLHDQTRDYINNVLSPAVDTAVAGSIPNITGTGNARVTRAQNGSYTINAPIITGSGAAQIIQNADGSITISVVGTGGDMLLANYANGNGANNNNTVDHALGADTLLYHSTVKQGLDNNGIYAEVQYRRASGSMLLRSVLSGGTSPRYTTRQETKYKADGTTVEWTKTYAITYDANDAVASEVLQ